MPCNARKCRQWLGGFAVPQRRLCVGHDGGQAVGLRDWLGRELARGRAVLRHTSLLDQLGVGQRAQA